MRCMSLTKSYWPCSISCIIFLSLPSTTIVSQVRFSQLKVCKRTRKIAKSLWETQSSFLLPNHHHYSFKSLFWLGKWRWIEFQSGQICQRRLTLWSFILDNDSWCSIFLSCCKNAHLRSDWNHQSQECLSFHSFPSLQSTKLKLSCHLHLLLSLLTYLCSPLSSH